MRCAALVRPLVPAPRPSIAGAVSDLMSDRKPCSLAVPTVVGASAAISDSATNARINCRCPLPLRKLAFSLVHTEFIGTRFLRRKIVGRCCNPVNHRGLHRSENGREAIADVGSAAPKTFRSRRTAPGGPPISRPLSCRRPSCPHWTIGWRQTPLPELPVSHTGQKFLRSRSALPVTADACHDRADADRPDALAAHDFGRNVRGLPLLNSGLIPEVPFSQFLFTSLGYDQYRPVRRALSFRIYLPGVSLFLLL